MKYENIIMGIEKHMGGKLNTIKIEGDIVTIVSCDDIMMAVVAEFERADPQYIMIDKGDTMDHLIVEKTVQNYIKTPAGQREIPEDAVNRFDGEGIEFIKGIIRQMKNGR